jgi:hypothetical protein
MRDRPLTKTDFSTEEIKATVNAYKEKMKANQEKIVAKMEAYQEEMRAEIKTGLEEVKAAESEANQQKTEDIAEHCEGAPCVKATHMRTALQVRASKVLHKDSKGVTNEETIGAAED